MSRIESFLTTAVGQGFNPDVMYGLQCLTEDSMILRGDYSYVSVKDLTVGETVLSDRGEQNEVLVNKPIESEVYRVQTDIGIFTASYDHLFKLSNGEFLEARKLNVGDEIALAKTLADTPSGLTDEELKFLGFWLGDGSKNYRWLNSRIAQIYVTVGVPKKYEFIESLGLDLKMYKHSNGKARQYYLVNKSHKKLSELINLIDNKQFSPLWTEHESKMILLGYLKADGSERSDHNGAYCSTNRQMALGLQQLAINADVKMTIRPVKERGPTNYCDNPKPITLGSYNLNKKPSGKVLSIDKLEDKQIVYALELSGNKTYIADGHIHHNCKDLADAYCIHLFGNWVNTIRPGNANVAFNNANPEFFHKIANNPNDPNLIPQRGDIITWGAMRGNPYGHIAVVTRADGSGVEVIEQDGFLQIPARLKWYPNYIVGGTLVQGWLRPRAEKIIGYSAPMASTERKLSHTTNARNEANTSSGIFQTIDAGSVVNMKGYVKGQNIEGEDRWYVTARSGKYMWFGGFESTSTDGLANLTPTPPQTAPEAKKENISTVESPKAPSPELHLFDADFDFVTRVEPILTENQFSGRKDLKENGSYMANIPKTYLEQEMFVEKLTNRNHHSIESITIHNTTNTSIQATINEFRRLNSFKSSHLVVSNTEIIQCVQKKDTAFTNGSHEGNYKSFTIEFLDDVSEDRYVEVLKKVSKALGVNKLTLHRHFSATQCPYKISDEMFERLKQKVFEAPKVEEPKVETPKTEIPKEIAPVNESPKQETTKAEATASATKMVGRLATQVATSSAISAGIIAIIKSYLPELFLLLPPQSTEVLTVIVLIVAVFTAQYNYKLDSKLKWPF